ncbi:MULTISPECIES: hypothetical protein [unclassified Bartonella]
MTRWCWWVGLAVGGFGWGLVTGGLLVESDWRERVHAVSFLFYG